MPIGRISGWLLTLSLLLLICSSHLRAQQVITLSTGEYPPLNSQRLKHNGLIPHIIREAFKLEGVEVRFEFSPWKRAYIRSQAGEVQGTAQFLYSEERAKEHYYSDPVIEEKVVWFHLKSTPFQWQQLSDLRDIRVGRLRGFTYSAPLYEAIEDRQFETELADEPQQVFEMMLRGRVDIFPENIDIGYYSIMQTFPDYIAVQFTNHPLPFLSAPSHLLLSRKHRNSPELLKKFNRGLKRLKESGLYDLYLDQSRRGDYLQ
jgi:polar amino acid transport system substrate-binding protein